MKGQRVPWPEGLFKPGEYAQHADGFWYGETPNGHSCNLRGHTVVEHEDGTITVSPSILVYQGKKELWHGFLERGVWREC